MPDQIIPPTSMQPEKEVLTSLESSRASKLDSFLETRPLKKPRRYCFGRFTRDQLVFLLLAALIIGVVLGAVIIRSIADSIVQNAIVAPSLISLNVAGYDASPRDEHINVHMAANVTNKALLGGVLEAAEMDVYVTLNNIEVKLASMKIPKTHIQGRIDEAPVVICSDDRSLYAADPQICSLGRVSEAELKLLHSLVAYVLQAPTLDMRLHAPNGVKLRAFGIPLPFTFAFNKQVTVKGMNGAMDKVVIDQFDLTSSTKEDLIFHATAVVDNPSVFGFTLLPSEMGIYVENHLSPDNLLFFGNSRMLASVQLLPNGKTRIEMEGVMPPELTQEQVEPFVQRYLSGQGNQVISKMVSNSSASRLLNAMLDGIQMHAAMLHGFEGDLFDKTTVNEMLFEQTSDPSVFKVATNMQVLLRSPVGESRMITKKMGKTDVNMKFNGHVVGKLTGTGRIVPSEAQEANPLDIEMITEGDLSIDIHDPDMVQSFAAFTEALMSSSGKVDVELEGLVGAVVDTKLGVLDLNNLHLNSKIQVEGMGGFEQNDIRSMDLTHSSPQSIEMRVEMDLFNPTTNVMRTEALEFNVVYQGTTVATLRGSEDMQINANAMTTMNLVGTISPEFIRTEQDKRNLGQLFSNYLNGIPTPILATGSKHAAKSNPILSLGLQRVALKSIMKPYDGQLITGLNFASLVMSKPTETGIHMETLSEIGTAALMGPNGIYQIQAVEMDITMESINGQVLGSCKVDATEPVSKASNDLQVKIAGDLKLAGNGDAMIKWMTTFVQQESMTMVVKGISHVAAILPGFTFPVTIPNVPVNNQVALLGMGKGTDGFIVDVNSFDMPRNRDNGIELVLDAAFHNPLIAEMHFGDMVTTMFYKGQDIGVIEFPDFTIFPSSLNQMKSSGIVRVESDAAFDAIEEFFTAYLHHLPSTCAIEATIPGSKWLTQVLRNSKMVSTIEGMDDDLQVLQSMVINEQHDLNVYMTKEANRFQGTITSRMNIPFDFPVELVSFQGQLEASSPEIGKVGILTIPPSECTGECRTSQAIDLPMDATLDPADSYDNLARYVGKMMGSSSDERIAMNVMGELSCEISTNLDFNGRKLKVSSLIDTAELDTAMTLPGFNSLGPARIGKMIVKDGSATQLPMETESFMTNPTSFVNMYADSLDLIIMYEGAPVAQVSSGDQKVVMLKGEEIKLTLNGFVNKELPGFDEAKANLLFSHFVSNAPSSIQVSAKPNSNYLLQDALIHVPLTTTLPPLNCVDDPKGGCPLVSSVNITDLGFNHPMDLVYAMATGRVSILNHVFVSMGITNPFPGNHIRPTNYSVNINYKDKRLGRLLDGPKNVTLEYGEVVALPMKLEEVNKNGLGRQMGTTCDLLLDRLYIDSAPGSMLSTKFGEFGIDLEYLQKDIKISCHMNNMFQQLCDAAMEKDEFFHMIKGPCRLSNSHRQKYLEEKQLRQEKRRRFRE